jgi:hypothetical protein
MRKPVAAVLDWFWARFTQFVMNQGKGPTLPRKPPP